MPEYTITVDIPDDEIETLRSQHEDWRDPDRWAEETEKASARLRAALLEAATPPPVTSITLDCMSGVDPNMVLEIDEDWHEPRLVVAIDEKPVLVPFDAVIDAVTQLRDTAKEMQQ